MTANRQFCTFTIDSFLFGIPVREVHEVLGVRRVTPLPLADPMIAGAIHLRGQVVTVMDLRRRLQLAERAINARPFHIILEAADGFFSLLVDGVGDVLEVEERLFVEIPSTISLAARDLVRGAYRLPDRLLLVLDTQSAIGVDRRHLLVEPL